MSEETKCASKDCPEPVVMAIKNTKPLRKGLVTTIYQDDRDAPKTAARYCIVHGVNLAANLAALSDASYAPVMTASTR